LLRLYHISSKTDLREMALIGLVTYCTQENKKFEMLKKTLQSLRFTVDLSKHRVYIFDNSTDHQIRKEVLLLVHGFGFIYRTQGENIGTARGINRIWQRRQKGEHCVKMDDDVVIHEIGWADQLEYAINNHSNIGIIGLKRKDCWERPDNPNTDFKSSLMFLDGVYGHKWVVLEKVNHVIGTCQMYNAELLDKIGYLYQIGLYGYDDVLASHRSHIAGFINCFLPHIEIDHIDDGATPYQGWKEQTSGAIGKEIRALIHKYYSTKEVYHDFY
jgi:hypothetical protein